MIIRDRKALERCRARGYCEVCLYRGESVCAGYALHAAHWKSVGSGGPDIDINLVCAGFPHHTGNHGMHVGKVTSDEILAIIAKRERRSPESIEEEIWRLAREPGKIVNGRRVK